MENVLTKNGLKYLPNHIMSEILNQDIDAFYKSFLLKNEFDGASFLITGATGLIGSTLVRCLLCLNSNIRITIPVRNGEKAEFLFGNKNHCLKIVVCDLQDYLNNLHEEFDYIVHLASPTAGKYMVEHPVETYSLAIESTKSILEYSRKVKVKSFVYVSSLEYYGQNNNDDKINEDFVGFIDYSSMRSCYPLGKRAAEYLCKAYAHEFGVPVKIARLTQTFGAGMNADDNRVFAQFARSIIKGDDIILHTAGESAKPYCYTVDCVSAILYIILKGEKGEAYNVANQETYISIKDLAIFLRDYFNPYIQVKVEEHPEMGYAPVTKLRLSAHKLESLGWKPHYNLQQMFGRLIDSMK